MPPKHLLKESVRDLLGDEILNRPKRGFEPPVHAWYNALLNAHGEIFENGHLENHQIVRRDFVDKARKPESMSRREREVAWAALNLEMWFRSLGRSSEASLDEWHTIG
ncbi:asparagine synthase-related protein [Roseibium album]|uniref:asparagine synthase-related protein n=1 Tax=Roseibium album TaxID=311410 RepID=UPI0009EA2530|nr:asparagine synthase-related protein [Roseibium album]